MQWAQTENKWFVWLNKTRLPRTALLIGLLGFLGLAAFGPSEACGQALFVEAWVDPVLGNDWTGIPDDPNFPYQTLQAAIWGVESYLSFGQEGIVHAQPGLYSNASNGEYFPIQMRRYVHVQGAGAKECVIRHDTTQTVSIWLPTTANGGDYTDGKVIIDCFELSNECEEMFDGFTLQGSDVQIFTNTEFHQRFRVSNCVFDLRNSPGEGFSGPEFGILMVSDYDPSGYKNLPWNILNNTFIQGQLTHAQPVVANPSNVAICAVNNPKPAWGDWDDDLSLRCVTQPSIQNNLIRSLPGYYRTALLGIDNNDVCALKNGILVKPTNAFVSTAWGGLSLTGTYTSNIAGPIPVPQVDLNIGLNGYDPAFVGEALSQIYSYSPFVRDWRLLPDSILKDRGMQPDQNGRLTAVNQTFYQEPPPTWPTSSFDYDGEGYGNPRVLGINPDIGFDEIDYFMVAGCYGNDSKSHNLPWDPTIQTGRPQRHMIFPGTCQITPIYSAVYYPTVPLGWTNPPGSIYPGVPHGYGTIWVDPAIWGIAAPINVTAMTQWMDPVDNRRHRFGETVISLNDLGAPIYLNEQVLYNDGVNPIVLSNLQSEIF